MHTVNQSKWSIGHAEAVHLIHRQFIQLKEAKAFVIYLKTAQDSLETCIAHDKSRGSPSRMPS